MRNFIVLLREQECLVEYEVEDDNCIFDVYPLNTDGTKGPVLELTDKETYEVNGYCWEHDHDSEQYPLDEI